MSGAPDSTTDTTTNTTGTDTSPPPAGSTAAALYPDGGGNGGAATTPLAPAGEASSTAPAGADTVAGGTGADTVAGGDTSTGADTGTDTSAAGAGQDTVAGADGADALTVESYKDLTLPEGFVVDDALMTTAKTTFAEIGIAPDKAPALIKLFADASLAAQTRATADFQAQQTTWLGEVNAMPEFQGEARATSLQAIGRVFDEYGTPEAKEALDAYGAGNNPALVKMFLKMASVLSEGAPTGQGRPAPTGADGKPASLAGKSLGQRLYPSQTQ
jgi:hypothetical protein